MVRVLAVSVLLPLGNLGILHTLSQCSLLDRAVVELLPCANEVVPEASTHCLLQLILSSGPGEPGYKCGLRGGIDVVVFQERERDCVLSILGWTEWTAMLTAPPGSTQTEVEGVL